MNKYFIITILIFSPLFAESVNVNTWMDHYYKDPAPHLFVEAVREFSSKGFFQNDNTKSMLEAFLAAVIVKNQSKVEEWLAELNDLPKNDLECIYNAI